MNLKKEGNAWTFFTGQSNTKISITERDIVKFHNTRDTDYGSSVSVSTPYAESVANFSRLDIHDPNHPNVEPSLIEIIHTHIRLRSLGVFPALINIPTSQGVDYLKSVLYFLGEDRRSLLPGTWYQIPIVVERGINCDLPWEIRVGNGTVKVYRRYTDDGYYSTKVVYKTTDYQHPRATNAVEGHVSEETRRWILNSVDPLPFYSTDVMKLIGNVA